jgi:hypothetical protein
MSFIRERFEYGENGQKERREKRSEGRYIMEVIDGGVLESGVMRKGWRN